MNSTKTHIAIIGGGASGLICACIAAKRYPDKKIVILERADRVGKKILVSGNGRCNLTNLDASIDNYHSNCCDNTVNLLLQNYPPQRIIQYFESIGLVCKPDSDNRVYPLSRQSSAVLSVLRNELKRNNVYELCNTEVCAITKKKSGYVLKCKDNEIEAEKVVIATGGYNNHAQRVVTNTYAPAQSLGHSVVKPKSCLSPVKVKSNFIKSLKGIRASAKVSAVVDGITVKSEYGELQFANDALSGICIFNLSGTVNHAKNAVIKVELLPDSSIKELYNMIINRIHLINNDTAQEIFTGLFHKNIGSAILKSCCISTSKPANQLTKNEIQKLADTISGWEFAVVPSNDFSNAQVTCGGVPTSEINSNTFESKIAKNVYLCGETVDVDGDCGGYNLQFAFSSGMCVGENI